MALSKQLGQGSSSATGQCFHLVGYSQVGPEKIPGEHRVAFSSSISSPQITSYHCRVALTLL